jgi:aryl-alcohol dehydrogenase-like predicted oxidoreductase
MKHRILGKTGLSVSEIGFGAWAIGGISEAGGVHWGWGEVPEPDAINAVRKAQSLGVNFFDTADVYGNGRSEEILGKALAKHWGEVYVASKVGNALRDGVSVKDWSREHITRSCEQSLKRLRKDVIDIYQLHNPIKEDILRGDWVETMDNLRQQGKIRFYGVSVFVPEEGLAVLRRGAGHVLQVAYNPLRQEMESEVLPMAQKKGFGIIARVPLYYGILAGKYTAQTTFSRTDHRSHSLAPEVMRELAPRADRLKPLAQAWSQLPGAPEGAGAVPLAEWSLKFVLAHPAVSTVIPGARNARQAGQNCAISDLPDIPADQISDVRRMWQQDAYLLALRTGL